MIGPRTFLHSLSWNVSLCPVRPLGPVQLEIPTWKLKPTDQPLPSLISLHLQRSIHPSHHATALGLRPEQCSETQCSETAVKLWAKQKIQLWDHILMMVEFKTPRSFVFRLRRGHKSACQIPIQIVSAKWQIKRIRTLFGWWGLRGNLHCSPPGHQGETRFSPCQKILQPSFSRSVSRFRGCANTLLLRTDLPATERFLVSPRFHILLRKRLICAVISA